MDIIIQTLDFTAKEELKQFVTSKVQGLTIKSYDPIRANVRLKLDRDDSRENKVCEIRIEIPGNDLYASRKAESFEAATMEVLSALRNQAEKLEARRSR